MQYRNDTCTELSASVHSLAHAAKCTIVTLSRIPPPSDWTIKHSRTRPASVWAFVRSPPLETTERALAVIPWKAAAARALGCKRLSVSYKAAMMTPLTCSASLLAAWVSPAAARGGTPGLPPTPPTAPGPLGRPLQRAPGPRPHARRRLVHPSPCCFVPPLSRSHP
jgi:hypothetical protein